jgi:hypothetical protein
VPPTPVVVSSVHQMAEPSNYLLKVEFLENNQLIGKGHEIIHMVN